MDVKGTAEGVGCHGYRMRNTDNVDRSLMRSLVLALALLVSLSAQAKQPQYDRGTRPKGRHQRYFFGKYCCFLRNRNRSGIIELRSWRSWRSGKTPCF